ncbi:hypothetical protein N7493_011222 [Penicillium malachiteum]|uniref:Uncharacterized protein n=1 Tax=Penicillium malachiteum TaxID=1324776 RepID=A0AAD6HBU3_9EURO|nr:hypothetical protein N7493_011222 [Penicillium malachiteum]
MVIVAGNYDGVKWLLREWPADIDLNNPWKAIWKFNFDDVLFDCLSSQKSGWTRDKLPQIQKRAATNILQCTREIDVSEEVFAQTSSIFRFCYYSGLLPLINVCIEENLPVPATEQLMRVVLDKCDTGLTKAIHKDLKRFRSLPDHHPGEFERMLW